MPELMNAREAAAKLRVHPSTLARWRSEGAGPKYVQMGARMMYRESAIEQWITANTVTPYAKNVDDGINPLGVWEP